MPYKTYHLRWLLAIIIAIMLVIGVQLPAPDSSLSDWEIAFNPEGTHIEDNQLKIRLDLFPPESVEPSLIVLVGVDSDISKKELTEYVKETFTPDNIATIESVLDKEDTNHYISSFFKDKTTISNDQTFDSEVIEQVNQRLSGFAITGNGKGVAHEVQHLSLDVGALTGTGSTYSVQWTFVTQNNPVNGDGIIDTATVKCSTSLGGAEVGMFTAAGNVLTTTDTEAIGAMTNNTPVTGLTISCTAGDYIGVYFTSGGISYASTAGINCWYKVGDYVPSTSETFSVLTSRDVSISGTGTTDPDVTMNTATSVEETTATITANITYASVNCTGYKFLWDTNTGEPYSSSNVVSGNFGVGEIHTDATGLTQGTLYYATCNVTNATGTTTAAEVTFLTKPNPATNFRSTDNGTRWVLLEWDAGTGADLYTIRYSTVSAPLTISSGSDGGTSTTTSENVSLEGNTTYYFTIFASQTDGGLTSYSDNNPNCQDTTDVVPDTVTIGDLDLESGLEGIAVKSNFLDDNNENHTVSLLYRVNGGSTWITGMNMIEYREPTLYNYSAELLDNSDYYNQHRTVILGLTENVTYEVAVVYTDADGGSGNHTSTIQTKTLTPPQNGTSYYVSTTGSNSNDGLSIGDDHAWLTVDYAASTVGPGDTVYILPGTYTETVTVDTSGNSTDWIRFTSYYTANRALVSGNTTTTGTFNLSGKDYIKIDNLNIRSSYTVTLAQRVGIYLYGQCDNLIISSCNITTLASGGTYNSAGINFLSVQPVSYTSGSEIYNVIVNDCLIHEERLTDAANGAYGILLYPTRNLTVKGCTITGNHYDGIGGGSVGYLYSGLYETGFIYDNYIATSADDAIEAEGAGVNVAVYNNRLYNPQYSFVATAPVFVGPTYLIGNKGYCANSTKSTVARKLGSASHGNLFDYHNTWYIAEAANVPEAGYGTYGSDSDSDNFTSRNNIFISLDANGYAVEYMPASTSDNFDYDCFYTIKTAAQQVKWNNLQMSYADWTANYSQEANGVWENVTFTDASTLDFSTNGTSAVVEAGVAITGVNDSGSLWAYSGTGPDIGADEYGSVAAPTISILLTSELGATSVRFNGEVTNTGGESCNVTIYWGNDDAGTTAGNWDNSDVPDSPAQPQGISAFYLDTTISMDTTYYIRARAVNNGGTSWSSVTTVFLSEGTSWKVMNLDTYIKIMGINIDSISTVMGK